MSLKVIEGKLTIISLTDPPIEINAGNIQTTILSKGKVKLSFELEGMNALVIVHDGSFVQYLKDNEIIKHKIISKQKKMGFNWYIGSS